MAEDCLKRLDRIETALVFAYSALANDPNLRQGLQKLLVKVIQDEDAEDGSTALPKIDGITDEVQRTLASSAGTLFHDLLRATTLPRKQPTQSGED